MQIIVESLTKAIMYNHIDEILDIEEACFKDQEGNFSDELWGRKQYLDDYEGKWELSQIAFNEKNEVVGVYSVTKIDKYCHANRLIVSPKYRRCGIGDALMKALINEVKRLGLEGLINFVHYDNTKSIKLLEKNGWKKCTGKSLVYYASLKGRIPEGNDYLVTEKGNRLLMMHKEV